MRALLLLAMALQTAWLGAVEPQPRSGVSLKGGLTNVGIAFVGPATTVSLKLGLGADYWFNTNIALGADIGMGSEGYGKVVGTTSNSLVNLKTGSFILDPGLTATFALDPIKEVAQFYLAARVGFPLYSGYSAAFSLSPTVGALIFLNKWSALDVEIGTSVVATYDFNYLATTISVGAVGLRIFL